MPVDPPYRRKGRGALSNPEGRFESRRVEPVDDGWQHSSDASEAPESEQTNDQDDAAELPPLQTTVNPEPARSIVTRNDSPDIGFEQSINPYRGCEHGCIYCASGDTRVLLSDGQTKALGDLRQGDSIYGTERSGFYRRYVRTEVLAHWETYKPAYRIVLADGTELVASGDHRFLTERGWKFVTGTESGRQRRPHLTTGNKLMGVGMTSPGSAWGEDDPDYRRGYLCGMIRGDGHLAEHRCTRANGKAGVIPQFRLALADEEALSRAASYLEMCGVHTQRFVFQKAMGASVEMHAIRTQRRENFERIQQLTAWPCSPAREWQRGFLAGIFDAEGSYSGGIIRISNTNSTILACVEDAMKVFGFSVIRDVPRPGKNLPVHNIRILGGLREHLRFFQCINPAISRKCDIRGQAVKSQAALDIVEIESLGYSAPMYDITTGTGDFIANGVISHNCFARPNHSYVNLSPGLDFETKLFYKQDAAQLLEKELRRPKYVCKPINIGASTDPYQPIEKKFQVTRSILEVMQRFRHPITIITKGHLVTRDIDILADLAKDELVTVYMSITTLDAKLKRGLEPRAPSPAARLGAVKQLTEAGVPVGVMMAPIIPAVNDHEIERLLEQVVGSGAQWAGHVLLRLPYEVKDLFREWLEGHMPLRAGHVMSLVRQMRNGHENDPRFGSRMRGAGPYAQLITRRFEAACDRLGLNQARHPALSTAHFRVPPADTGQLALL